MADPQGIEERSFDDPVPGGAASTISRKSLWTIGVYAVSAAIRFLTNIVLSHLLAPQILGIVVIAQAVRTGAELLTDMGMEQNVVHSPHGDDERFLNTVWTIQLLRGGAIALVCAAAAYAISGVYHVEPAVLVAISAAPFLNALASTSVFGLARHLEIKAKNIFEVSVEAVGLLFNIVLAVWLRNAWAPILGILLTLAVRSAASYLLPHPRHRLLIDRTYSGAIFAFGKWVMLSSLMLFGAVYADRLLLGLVATLTVLGIYGLARALSDFPSALASRLAMQIVFPVVARDKAGKNETLRRELAHTRRYVLLLFTLGTAGVMIGADGIVRLLYDARYAQAGWMLFLLAGGSWVSVLAWLGEATMFGQGLPRSVGIANTVRLAAVAVTLPLGYMLFGLPGAVLAVPASEVARYAALRIAQRHLPDSFARQDALFALAFVFLLGVGLAVRAAAGWGVPWAAMG